MPTTRYTPSEVSEILRRIVAAVRDNRPVSAGLLECADKAIADLVRPMTPLEVARLAAFSEHMNNVVIDRVKEIAKTDN